MLALGVLLGLLAAVSIASTGDTPIGSGGTRRPSHALLDVMLSLVLVVMAFGILVLGYLLVLRRDLMAEHARLRRRKRRRDLAYGVVVFGLLAVIVWWTSARGPARGPEQPAPVTGNAAPGGGEGGSGRQPYEPQFALIPILVLGVLLAAVAGGAYLSSRARRRHLTPTDDGLALVLIDVLDETLDDLRRETDPARAVIAAYARLERTLAACGLQRRAAEAPEEYVARVLDTVDVGPAAVDRLTALYLRAKFSQHEVDGSMKDDAIDALEQVRDELRAAEERAALERALAVAAAQERADEADRH